MTTEKAAAELRAWVAEEARRAREFDSAEHRREAFPQTATGRALSTSPLSRSARGPLAPGPLIVQRDPTEGVTAGAGWQVTLTADTTVPTGGGNIEFGTVETSHGVTVTAPTTELVVPQECVCSVQHLHLHWTNVDNDAAWKGHGAWAEIRVNGTAVAPRMEAGADGLSYSRLGPLPGPKMALSQGDVVTLHVFQNSGSSQPVTGRLSLGMEDPIGAPPAPFDPEALTGNVEGSTHSSTTNNTSVVMPSGVQEGDMLLVVQLCERASFSISGTTYNPRWTLVESYTEGGNPIAVATTILDADDILLASLPFSTISGSGPGGIHTTRATTVCRFATAAEVVDRVTVSGRTSAWTTPLASSPSGRLVTYVGWCIRPTVTGSEPTLSCTGLLDAGWDTIASTAGVFTVGRSQVNSGPQPALTARVALGAACDEWGKQGMVGAFLMKVT